ncbi:hypothetical protein [Burkholderia stagnalis]|uniref:hypothetical protein n=1 Tax=Burkholderia stagnalis TaxID=1503054 RepID=UPI0021AB48E8|nr:hypothetical protein [Burkholderia stagnalis]
MTAPEKSSPAPASTANAASPQDWRYPFPDKERKEITDPQAIYSALGLMDDGFFPLGVNGFPHGGVHFGRGTSARFDQAGGVRAIANGMIVAYKLDDAYKQLKFTQDSRWSMYSTGFVLVRHEMTMPPAPGSTGAQPPDETLTFFSLYMHLADWQSYEVDGTLARPGWWPVPVYRIGNTERQEDGGQAPGSPGTRGCIRRSRKASSTPARLPVDRARSRSSIPSWVVSHRAGECRCHNDGGEDAAVEC